MAAVKETPWRWPGTSAAPPQPVPHRAGSIATEKPVTAASQTAPTSRLLYRRLLSGSASAAPNNRPLGTLPAQARALQRRGVSRRHRPPAAQKAGAPGDGTAAPGDATRRPPGGAVGPRCDTTPGGRQAPGDTAGPPPGPSAHPRPAGCRGHLKHTGDTALTRDVQDATVCRHSPTRSLNFSQNTKRCRREGRKRNEKMKGKRVNSAVQNWVQ